MDDGSDLTGSPDDEVEIRQATADDADALVPVYHDAYAANARLGFPAKAGSATAATITEWIEDDRVFVAVRAGEVVGAVRVAATDPDRLQVNRFAVRPDAQGQGIGSRLLAQVETLAREEGYGTVWLTTPPEHPTLPEYYRERGYEKTGEWPLEYREYDEIVMEKSLR